MEIIAKTTNGVLITATEQEVKTILKAVSSAPDKLEIGMKIPAIDYAGTITKIKSLNENYDFKQLVDRANDMQRAVMGFKNDVDAASKAGEV